MIRYNRVEGLAAGLEFDAVVGGFYTLRTGGSSGWPTARPSCVSTWSVRRS